MALYNDVMLGILDADLKTVDLAAKYAKDEAVLQSVPANRFDYLFDTQKKLVALLRLKCDLSIRIKDAYRTGNKQALKSIVENDIPSVDMAVDAFNDALRFQWHKINKPFGFEVQDIRMGGIKERLKTATIRINGYLDGSIKALEELEQEDLPYLQFGSAVTDRLNGYSKMPSAGRIAW